MSERLATWLETHATTIMPRWARVIRERGVSDEKIGTADLRNTFFSELYDGLIEAARGNIDALTAALQAVKGVQNRTNQTLPHLLEIPFQLRRIIWDTVPAAEEPHEILADFERA